MVQALTFPLFERAVERGVLEGQSALIVAPTATGKSYIGREVVRSALERRKPGPHAYLVPFRSLANEVYDGFHDLLESTKFRLRISTGDYREPIRPEESDLIVATYESFAALVRRTGLAPGTVIADEIHLVADDHRGPVVEGLLSRLLASGRITSLCGLSAVVENGKELADWLKIDFLEGTREDRPVALQLRDRFVQDLDKGLKGELRPCLDGGQGLVFCSSRRGAEKTARFLSDEMKLKIPADTLQELYMLSAAVLEEDPEAEGLAKLLPTGVAFHHAGLVKSLRRKIESAYRDRWLRILTATPTLAAGVNLPADIVVVRDVFRADVVRGIYRQVLVPSGEILNMLGRAGRPHQAESGVGVALIEKRHEKDPKVKTLRSAIEAGRGTAVHSQLLDSFEGIMRFVLAVVVEHGETTREDVAKAFRRTLAHYHVNEKIEFDRPFEDDLMEDIPCYKKVLVAQGAIRLHSHRLSPDGVHAEVFSSGKIYEVTLGVTGITCTCPAASQYYRGSVCKHQACAIHDLLFASGIDPEVQTRAIYNCGHVFGKTLDVGTRLDQSLRILTTWGMVEHVPGGFRVTKLGEVASTSGLDLLFVRQAIRRITGSETADYREVAGWAVEDYLAEEKHKEKWLSAVRAWLDEEDVRKISHPARYRGDFEQRVEDLSRVCLLYEKAAEALGKPSVAEAAHTASLCLRYGVAPEVVPLMALGFANLRRARSRYLYDKGIRGLDDLSRADPSKLTDPKRVPEAFAREWVSRAQEIHQARAAAIPDGKESDPELDELISRFRLDPAALT